MAEYRSVISRRHFLAGSIVAGAALGTRPAPAGQAAVDPDRWTLISDTHVWEKREGKHSGVNPDEHLVRVRNAILAQAPRPAGIILSGDCVFLEGHAADYAVLADLVAPFATAGLPVHFVLGNHDNRKNFWTAFPQARPTGKCALPGKQVAIVQARRANWFLLDSLDRTNHTPGLLGKAQLDWLAAELDARPDKPALIVAHHNPDENPRGSGLRDTEALFRVLAPRKQVKAYLFGHTHVWNLARRDGIHLVNLPATAWVFDAKQPWGWVDARLADGGMRLTLHAFDPRHAGRGRAIDLKWRT